MTFSDKPFEKAKIKHREHKEQGIKRKENCRMCQFYDRQKE